MWDYKSYASEEGKTSDRKMKLVLYSEVKQQKFKAIDSARRLTGFVTVFKRHYRVNSC